MLGLNGDLTIVDADRVETPNLNRQLIFTARDAGYPDGEMKEKAERAAARLGPRAVPEPHWYGESDAIVNADYDIVLALANERGAREALQDRRSPVLLHATTSPNHQAQFHRHLPGKDDCIRCRVPGTAAKTACATAPVTEARSDAALPYLSGLAGLMLAAALARHGVGMLADGDANLAVIDLGGTRVAYQTMSLQCQANCRTRVDRALVATRGER
jgi:molybdopterin/thiamine biosynthesis adenylyltransferase